jgi:hypothetical protein
MIAKTYRYKKIAEPMLAVKLFLQLMVHVSFTVNTLSGFP